MQLRNKETKTHKLKRERQRYHKMIMMTNGRFELRGRLFPVLGKCVLMILFEGEECLLKLRRQCLLQQNKMKHKTERTKTKRKSLKRLEQSRSADLKLQAWRTFWAVTLAAFCARAASTSAASCSPCSASCAAIASFCRPAAASSATLCAAS